MTVPDISALLDSIRAGDRAALDELVPILYDELRHIAHVQLGRRSGGETLQTTALVHEAYLRLVQRHALKFENSDHFFAATATVMRHIVVDHARRRLAARRGGGQSVVSLDALGEVGEPELREAGELLALNGAIEHLQRLSPRLAAVVELRFFAGFSVEETARIQGCDARTVKRDWQKARLLLQRFLADEEPAR